MPGMGLVSMLGRPARQAGQHPTAAKASAGFAFLVEQGGPRVLNLAIGREGDYLKGYDNGMISTRNYFTNVTEGSSGWCELQYIANCHSRKPRCR